MALTGALPINIFTYRPTHHRNNRGSQRETRHFCCATAIKHFPKIPDFSTKNKIIIVLTTTVSIYTSSWPTMTSMSKLSFERSPIFIATTKLCPFFLHGEALEYTGRAKFSWMICNLQILNLCFYVLKDLIIIRSKINLKYFHRHDNKTKNLI